MKTATEVLEELAKHCGVTPEQTLALLLRSEMNLCIDSALHECLKQPLGDTPLIRTHADTKTWACNVMKEMLHK